MPVKPRTTQPSLLGTNILRGGRRSYNANVLVDNWWNERLSPDYVQLYPSKKHEEHKRCYVSDWEERMNAFTNTGRTDIDALELNKSKINPIGTWEPKDENLPHRPIDNHFETMYELTFGDPKWKNQKIPVGSNILSYPNSSHNFDKTEYRESYINRTRILQSDEKWRHLKRSDPSVEKFSATRLADYSTGNAAKLIQQSPTISIPYVPLTVETQKKEYNESNHDYLNEIPDDALIPTHHLGIPSGYPKTNISRVHLPFGA